MKKLNDTHFNSGVVRLKGSPFLLPTIRDLDFNSGVVRLKGGAGYSWVISRSNFNSGVVRLKGLKVHGTQLGIYISIPVWCD